MFVATSTNSNHPPSYIVAATTTTTATNPTSIETVPATTNATPQTLTDIKLICTQRKKKTKRHIYLTFVESCPLTTSIDQPCIEIIRKNTSSTSYPLSECISFEYFDTVKNDFQAFIYIYFESYTISIFFSDDNTEKKSFIIKHLEHMYQNKSDQCSEINNNISQESSTTISPQSSQQTPILPCPSTTEHILHTFDVNLIPYGPIIHRDHILVGPARLYFTTTDLYIALISFNRTDLKITITNQCPSKDKAILCIPYFTIKNYGNRSNIFLIELGKSNYGNGEIHMKCQSSSLASTIHLLVSPVIEERPLILSSAFQNQLLTHKRMEKSKNIHPPVQLNNDTTNQSILESPLTLVKKKSTDNNTSNESRTGNGSHNDMKSRFVVGFFRSLTKNVSHLRRSATFHHQNNNTNNQDQTGLNNNNNNNQHQILLPESQKKSESTTTISSVMTKKTIETLLTSTSSINTNKQEPTNGTYIDMGPTVQTSDQHQDAPIEDEVVIQETTATADIGVNTMISLSPQVRSAIIVGNTVHLIADEKTLFPIGQRSFTSPASVMQPFKTQLNGQTMINPYAASTDLITSSPNSSSSLHQANSVSNSQQSLLLSYGIVTFNNNDLLATEQSERAISPPTDGSTLDRRLDSDLSLISNSQHQNSTSIHPFDRVLSSSSAHIFHTLSVSTNNIGDPTSSSIIFLDDHLNDQTTTYLLGPPPMISEENLQTNLSRLSSVNLTKSISRPHLSYIDEEKSSDPYALVEPLTSQNSPQSTSVLTLNNPLLTADNSIHYTDICLPMPVNSELSDSNDQQQFHHSDEPIDENSDLEEQDRDTNEHITTKLYTDIDFHQTQRRDRIIQSAARAKLEDQTPPFVL